MTRDDSLYSTIIDSKIHDNKHDYQLQSHKDNAEETPNTHINIGMNPIHEDNTDIYDKITRNNRKLSNIWIEQKKKNQSQKLNHLANSGF